ncbi:hypothetical protein [Leptospira noguchii]|nr:hypothetical protein [Leptospira noguchii]
MNLILEFHNNLNGVRARSGCLWQAGFAPVILCQFFRKKIDV